MRRETKKNIFTAGGLAVAGACVLSGACVIAAPIIAGVGVVNFISDTKDEKDKQMNADSK